MRVRPESSPKTTVKTCWVAPAGLRKPISMAVSGLAWTGSTGSSGFFLKKKALPLNSKSLRVFRNGSDSYPSIYPQDEHERLLVGRLAEFGVAIERLWNC
jgi:hypothetical protein